MKKVFFLFGMCALLFIFACSKSSSTTPSGTSTLKFESLSANDTVIKVNAITTVNAKASGEGLTYTWTASYGTFIGSGAKVQWTVCHSDRFTITCVVKDNNNNSDSKTISIKTID